MKYCPIFKKEIRRCFDCKGCGGDEVEFKVHAVARGLSRANYFCPCGFFFGTFSYKTLQYFDEPENCPGCGSKLDWSEANDWTYNLLKGLRDA